METKNKICRRFGISRAAFYKATKARSRKEINEELILALVRARKEARKAVKKAIWIYNHHRLHEKLNYKTLAAFRAEWFKEAA
jgi:transposase InsO family protein